MMFRSLNSGSGSLDIQVRRTNATDATIKRFQGKVAIVTASTDGGSGSLDIQVRRTNATDATIKRFQGKVAIVTASTDGIGYAIAERLAREGAAVVVSSRKQDNVQRALKSLKAEGLKVAGTVCHVANADDRQKLFDIAVKEFGGLDILVSNAAVNPVLGPMLECDEKVWDKIFEVNVKNSWQLVKEAYPHLQRRGGGSVLFVASVAAYRPTQPLGVYAVSKTTLLGLTKGLARELAADNIRVNCLAPGIIKTRFAEVITKEDGKAAALSTVSQGRFGQPEEMGAAAAFLVSEDASYVTGETLVAAGPGASSRL